MEASSWFSVASLVFLVVGVAVGVAAGHFFSPAIGEAKRLRSDLERLQHEHDSYRSSVNSHFRKTADLVGQMTKSYAAVYDHLAGGARRFCDDSGPEAAIPFGPLPGALASPVIETAAGPDTDGDLPDLAADPLAAEGDAETAGELAARDDLQETADALEAREELQDLAAAGEAEGGSSADGYSSDGYPAEEYSADDYAVAGSDETGEETEERPTRT